MRPRPIVGLLVLSLGLTAVTGAQARKKTYCQRAVAARHSKLVGRSHGMTVYREGRTIDACSDSRRISAGLYIMDPGYRAVRVVAARGHCLAILFTSAKGLPQILSKDLGGKEAGSTVLTIGYGYPAARVASLSVAANCVMAWGSSVTDGAGATTYHVQLEAFGAASSVFAGGVNEVATVKRAADIRHVKVRAVGRRAKVRWTEGGKRRSKLLP